MMKKITLLSLFFLACCFKLQSQSLVLKTRTDSGLIRLRWAIADFEVIKKTILSGFMLSRSENQTDWKILDTIYCSGQQQLEKLAEKNDFAKIWQYLLYENIPVAEVKTYSGLALLTADIDSVIAKTSGLSYVDYTITAGIKYAYKLQSLFSGEEVTAIAEVLPTEDPVPEIDSLSCKNFSANIAFDKQRYRSHFSSYELQRSEDSIIFYAVHDAPIIPITNNALPDDHFCWWSDSLNVVPQKYFYRLRAFTPFGTASAYSDVRQCVLQLPFTCYPVIDSFHAGQGQLSVYFHLSDSLQTARIKQFRLLSAKNYDGPFSPVNTLSRNGNRFMITTENDCISTFFKAELISNQHDTVSSWPKRFIFVDSIPPAVPQKLSGSIDSAGNVVLNWLSNQENDLSGYRVFRRNTNHEAFIEITKSLTRQAFFQDILSVRELNKEIQYAVCSVDKYYNASDLSPPLILNRPDHIPPVTPVFDSVKEQSGIVSLRWTKDFSGDVHHYKIARFTTDTSITIIPAGQNVYADSTKLNNYVRYGICACDLFNNCSTQNYITVRVAYETTDIPVLHSAVDRSLHFIKLNWESETDYRQIIILRGNSPDLLEPVAVFNGPETEFTDQQISPGNSYWYQLVCKTKNGKTFYSRPVQTIY